MGATGTAIMPGAPGAAFWAKPLKGKPLKGMAWFGAGTGGEEARGFRPKPELLKGMAWFGAGEEAKSFGII